MKLNIGCQIHYFEGWTNQDVVGDDPNMKVDLVCDAINLPLAEKSVEFIYAGHLVEHFYPDTLPIAIKEWHRVLQDGGTLVVLTPDCGALFHDYASGRLKQEDLWQQIFGRIYSYDREPERHHITFDAETLNRFMTSSAQWKQIRFFDFQNPPAELMPFMDKHISRGAYQLGLILTK